MSSEQRRQLEEELILLKRLLEFHNLHEEIISSTTMTPDEHIDYRIGIMTAIHELQQLLGHKNE